jgi:aspartyl-tRNA(Asn)/glutamyl-tRNA(Gln) amidotransferase subunit A
LDALWRLSVSELRVVMQARMVSPVDVVRAVLEHADAVNGDLNAVVTFACESALARARSAERQYQRGHVLPLLGIPVTVKDTIPTAGIRTTFGSLLYRDYVPDRNAPVVDRLLRAGAIIVGKTNTSEFGWKAETSNRVFGTTRNPWDLSRTAGGSSGGAASAVAAGIGPVAIGSDAAGSTRLPGAFCGVVGLKPSFGRIAIVPRGGLETLSHVGVLARTVEDTALVLDVAAGLDRRDRFSLEAPSIKYTRATEGLVGRRLRVGWTADLGFTSVHESVKQRVEGMVRVFAEANCDVEELSLEMEDPYDAIHVFFCAALAGERKGDYDQVQGELDSGCRQVIEQGFALSSADYGAAILKASSWREQWAELAEPYDLIITPTIGVAAFPAGLDCPPTHDAAEGRRTLAWTPFTYPFNLTGQPAISVPSGFTPEGLPMGIQIVGRYPDDASVLRAAAVLESAHSGEAPWPPLVGDATKSRMAYPAAP